MRAVTWCVLVWSLSGCNAAIEGATGAGPASPPVQGWEPPPLTTGGPSPEGPQCEVAPSSDPLVVATRTGAVRGLQQGGTLSFRGIPYAAPPVGAGRFRPPAQHACWSGVRDATQYGSACVQPVPNNGTLGDEDCLFLNVWTPAIDANAAPRPVLFFIYGGAYIMGSGNQDLLLPGVTGNVYDGAKLAQTQNAVVVTFNYRLGDLGFLAHPALAAEDAHGSTSNYALLDQIAALGWVRDNITAFGGDPRRVTIFGESAGGQSVCMLLGSPLAHGLFSAAVMESGVCKTQSIATAYGKGAATAKKVGCDGAPDVAACLREKPASAFVNPIDGLAGMLVHFVGDFEHAWELGPTVDGWVLPEPPVVAMRKGTANAVPLIVGTNAQELELFTAGGLVPTPTCLGYLGELQLLFQDSSMVDRVASHYPCNAFDLDPMAPHRVLVSMGTDMMFRCPARRILRAMHQASTGPVYRYLFTQAYSNPLLSPLRSFHAAELMYLFDSFDAAHYTPTAGDRAVSGAMQDYWGRFATTGDPNGGYDHAWPRFQPSLNATLVFQSAMTATASAEDPSCDFWDGFATDW